MEGPFRRKMDALLGESGAIAIERDGRSAAFFDQAIYRGYSHLGCAGGRDVLRTLNMRKRDAYMRLLTAMANSLFEG